MVKLHENIPLKPLNTFSIEATARWFSSFSTQDELAGLLDFTKGRAGVPPRLLILGGGSNILFTGNFDGLVLKNEIRGIELVREDEKYVYVRAGAGESWHGFVQYCLQRNWAGVENLSLIPGNVGAAPMQNIGAYGVEIKEVFYELEAWDLEEHKVFTFSLNDCEFGYRDSVFKRRLRGRAIILDVIFRLNKIPKFHTEYGAIRAELDKMGVQTLSIQAISQAVINIRSSKLPDPKQIGNAGSFFKNPTVTGDRFAALQREFPGIPGYPAGNANTSASSGASVSPASSGASAPSALPGHPPVKLAAGWLIEQCGWKGYRHGDAGCHALQALVLVNYGHASGKEIYELSEEILQSVKNKFGVELEREVNIIA
ncbi:MAG TPA: UDP-N-acetylmuramate dehydrogenase [Puia sp.]|nr:UDP-N-acetylmuramate dehydrogenase [Puia sp.]